MILGSIKSNIGHLEGASGIVGFIKAVKVLQKREVPGSIHLKNLNSKINLDNFDAIITADNVKLKQEGKLLAGVSSFGFGGTNAHVILESYPNEES